VGDLPKAAFTLWLNCLTLQNPVDDAIWREERFVSAIKLVAICTLCARAIFRGDDPRWRLKRRRRCLDPIPTRSASCSKLPSLSAPSEISLTAWETTAHVPNQAEVPGDVSGRHRLQGRNPAASAADAD